MLGLALLQRQEYADGVKELERVRSDIYSENSFWYH